MNDYEKIEKILIELTNTLNYDNQNDDHKDAYIFAFDSLCSLIDKIDSAKRV